MQGSDPAVSVGVCAHNEEETIGVLLDQVLAEDIPVCEIIVVVAGEDETAAIVEEKGEDHPEITLIEESERRGQVFAQNKIVSEARGDALLFLDGDGTIEPRSLETLWRQFDGKTVLSGREIPVTPDTAAGTVIDMHARIHHRMCCRQPRFSTQIGIIPAGLVETFPPIVHDDVYIEHRAMEEGLPITYVPSAIKYHHLPPTLKFFFHQQTKNWAGRFEAQRKGYHHSKPNTVLLSTFLDHLRDCSPRDYPVTIALGLIELFAFSTGKIRDVRGDAPVKWWRASQ